MRVVLDTNVVVSGFLNPHGAPGTLVRLAASGELQLCYDSRILSEYREVLARPKFGLDPEALNDFLEQVEADGFPVDPAPLARRLPDPTDEPFLEAAVAGRAVCLVTGNLRHFPANRRCGVRVLSPAPAVDLVRGWVD